tara:strand:+ start:134 stop:298 length:165 start_codon:yes stop_codon:yes gene_type:complete
MKKYIVGIVIYNTFEIEALSKKEAEEKVKELDVYDTLEHCDTNVAYVEEVKDEE